MRNMAITLAALVAFAAPAQAAVVLSENFDGQNGGASALNYTGFTNFTAEGQVDLIKSGDFGITCSGSCVDLDGSPGPGALVTAIFGYGVGDLFNFNLSIGGNQRQVGTFDDVFITAFDGVTNAVLGTTSTSVASGAGFSTWLQTYGTSGTGSVYFKIGSLSADNQGPLLDSITIDVTSAVPEPATWAMMIGGFGLVGASMRRRKVSVRFA
jgi:hypothetical protein